MSLTVPLTFPRTPAWRHASFGLVSLPCTLPAAWHGGSNVVEMHGLDRYQAQIKGAAVHGDDSPFFSAQA